MSKEICCPKCGPRIKLFYTTNDLLIKEGAIEIKCRKCKSIVCVYGDGKTVTLSKNI